MRKRMLRNFVGIEPTFLQNGDLNETIQYITSRLMDQVKDSVLHELEGITLEDFVRLCDDRLVEDAGGEPLKLYRFGVAIKIGIPKEKDKGYFAYKEKQTEKVK